MYNCPVCDRELQDNDLICPSCKTRVAERRQEEKLQSLNKKTEEVVKKEFASPAGVLALIGQVITLPIYICLILWLFGSFKVAEFSTFEAVVSIVMICCCGFWEIRSLIGSVKLFSSKKTIEAGDLNEASYFAQNMEAIFIIFAAVVEWIVFLCFLVGNEDVLSLFTGKPLPSTMLGTNSLILIAVMTLIVFITLNICMKKIYNYYQRLFLLVQKNSVEIVQMTAAYERMIKKYSTKQPPYIFSFICAGICGCLSLGVIITLPIIGFWSVLICVFFIGVTLYLFAMPIVFKKIKVGLDEVDCSIREAKNELERIENETIKVFADEKINEQHKKDLQQMMMQQMMQQMLANSAAAEPNQSADSNAEQ